MKSLKFAVLAAVLLPVYAYADGFKGPYLGASLGGVFAKEQGTGYDAVTHAKSGYTHKTEPDGFLLGLKGGYGWVLGNNVLLGVEAGYDVRDNNDQVFQKNNGVTDPAFRKTTSLDASASVLARIGYAFSPRSAVYALAGVSAAKVKRKYEALGVDSESHSNWANGWTVGVGGEHLLSRNLSANLEYRFSDFGKDKVNVQNWSEYYNERLKDQSLRIGISYKF